MLHEVVQAIKMLKRIGTPSKEVQDTLEYLESAVKKQTKQNLIDLMTVGDAIGYEELHTSLSEAAAFVEAMRERSKQG